MSTTPWRGTLLFAGSLATIAVAAVTRFAGATEPPQAGSASVVGTSGTSSGTSGTTSGTTAAPGASATNTQSGAAPAAAAPVVIVGNTVQTRYGPVQVSVTFTGKTITAVQALQVPGGHQESVMINNYAAPILAQEAVAANSAKIDTVSGATFTSQAYKTSLQSAIDLLG